MMVQYQCCSGTSAHVAVWVCPTTEEALLGCPQAQPAYLNSPPAEASQHKPPETIQHQHSVEDHPEQGERKAYMSRWSSWC